MTNKYGVPDTTLQDKVRFSYAYACVKHSFHPDSEYYADKEIDKLRVTLSDPSKLLTPPEK
jgi:hypothetical protein